MELSIAGDEQGASEWLKAPHDESVKAAIMPFRNLYKGNEPCSFDAVRNMLGQHVHARESSRQADALHELSEIKKLRQEVGRFQGIGIALDGWTPNADELFDLFFNALYFHTDHEHGHLLNEMTLPILRFEFLSKSRTY
jgi:hypothetical protein